MRQGSQSTQKRSNCARESRFRSVMRPAAIATASSKTFLARSTAIVTLFIVGSSGAGCLIGVRSQDSRGYLVREESIPSDQGDEGPAMLSE